ncbi:SCO3374 family protein [Streptomyces sp. MNU89]|uniref:SCO3374 family protein n=1 Tax=Streptomyces sp. MNU89 TaxID=2560025 RepID=UPI001E525CD6|nr:SCO3374 family protein [Streptomyces sp. MNU89]MCC9740145.1 SCO3374 family protein [Streptomyces sp. MNU89]
MTTAPGRPRTVPADERAARDWYEHGLGWPTAGGTPLELLTGVRFDVLELPAAAGLAVLRRVPGTGPVALHGTRMRLLVAPGSAQELPELLRWLEWGGVPLGLSALGAGGRTAAPLARGAGGGPVWLRPPVPGREVEPALPAATVRGGTRAGGAGASAPDLVRLLGTAATECHRARLLRGRGQPFAFS